MRRTTATTEYLKECMGTALLELMREKPLEKISIEEMTARADVGRSTYFRYFRSKDEVLSFKICCLWKRFDAQHHVGGRGASEATTAARLFFEGQSQILCKLQMRHEQSRIIHCARQRIYPTAALCAV